jgi:Amt family ammonium transporter
MNRRAKFVLGGFLAALLVCAGSIVISKFATAQETTPPAATETPATPAAETPPAETPPAEATPAVETPPAEGPSEEKKEEAVPADTAPVVAINETQYAIDNITLFICAVLVIFMQAGFALVETGLNAAKNAVNIMFKNYMDFMLGAMLFWFVGYGIMYPAADNSQDLVKNVFGFAGVGLQSITPNAEGAPTIAAGSVPTAAAAHPLGPQVNFLFQVAFAATAATIVSGSVAGRMKFPGYLVYTAVITGLIYPISGMWMWGYGWLFDMGFKDFAGSVVVHAVGGFAGLAGAIALGPRIGKFVNGKAMPMPGHNIPYATLGVFILVIGWYGFNPGSQLAFTGMANTDTIMLVAVNTTLAACAGAVSSMIFSWAAFKKPDLTFSLNGGLAGLVGITANCHCVTNTSALIIGGIAGVLVCLACLALDKLQIDDPVGAFPVHGVCGMWGGIATGIFGIPELAAFSADAKLSLMTQIIGTLSIAGWALGSSLVLFFALKAIGLLRVSAEEELGGLDINEHGMYAYPPQLVVETFGGATTSIGSSSPAFAGHAKPSTEAV